TANENSAPAKRNTATANENSAPAKRNTAHASRSTFSENRSALKEPRFQPETDSAPAPPVVHISIGRVELRAAPQPTAAPAPQRQLPPVSLSEFLKQQRGRR